MMFCRDQGGVVTEAGILKDVAGSSAQSCNLGKLLLLPVRVLNSSKTCVRSTDVCVWPPGFRQLLSQPSCL